MADAYQVTMKIGNKTSASKVGRPTGDPTYPPNGSVSIAVMPPSSDSGRAADIHRTVRILIDYVRDNKSFSSAGSMAFVTTLDGGKAAVREEPIATNVLPGEIALMVTGSVRALGNRMDTENAHRQLLDWAIEKKH